MISQNIFIPLANCQFQIELLEKGCWIAILHAQRFPPHAGLLFTGNYNSLTIKEAETNISKDLLLKTITQKKIKSIFIKVCHHPVFSLDHQKEIFQHELKKTGPVKQNETTCLTPLKFFFKEFYGIRSGSNELLFDFIKQLSHNGYLEYAMAKNMELNEGIDLPFYTLDELNEKIKTERLNYYNS